MKLAILSDTHNLLRPQVLQYLEDADAIVHAGDISTQSVVDTLNHYAPVYVVRGNTDEVWAASIPHDLTFQLQGLTFYMVHKKSEIPKSLPGVDVVIFGHSHRYFQEEKDGILYLNPGSCGPRRFHQEITLAMMELENGSYSIEKILIPHSAK